MNTDAAVQEAAEVSQITLAMQAARSRLDERGEEPGAFVAEYRANHRVTLPTEDNAKLLRRSRIPRKTWDYSLGAVIELQPGELHGSLKARADHAHAIGIIDGNREAMEWLRDWRPGRDSIWLEGSVGRGKSLLLSAAVQALLLEPVELVAAVGVTRDQFDQQVPGYRRTGGTSVYWTSETDLVRDEDNHRKFAKDNPYTPIKRACSVAVLVADDFLSGAEGQSKKRREWVSSVWEEVIGTRYDEGLPILFSSNLPLDAIATHHGQRMQSRINEMCAEYSIEVSGPDWRAL